MFTNGLAARGHNVTVLSADRDKNAPNGVHYIHMEGLYGEHYAAIVKDAFVPHESSPFEALDMFSGYMTASCEGDQK